MERGKPQKISVKIADVLTESRTEQLPNTTSKDRYRLSQLYLAVVNIKIFEVSMQVKI
jgi:hypothetical protein